MNVFKLSCKRIESLELVIVDIMFVVSVASPTFFGGLATEVRQTLNARAGSTWVEDVPVAGAAYTASPLAHTPAKRQSCRKDRIV